MSRRILLGSVLLIAGAGVWMADDSSPAPPLVVPAAERRPASGGADAAEAIPPLVERTRLFPGGSGVTPFRDLFAASSPALPVGQASAPPMPAAPEFPFTYLGKRREGSAWAVFLSRDDMTLVLKPGDLIEDTYRVVSIAPPVLTVVYQPLNHRYLVPIGDEE